MKKSQANLILLFAAMIWGGGFLATEKALETFHPFMSLFIRFGGAAIISWLICLIAKPVFNRETLIKGSICGICMYTAFAFQTFGLDLTDTGTNAFLTSVNVVLVPILAFFLFHARIRPIQALACVMTLAGIGMLSLSHGSLVPAPGDLLSLACALFFAMQIIALSWAADQDAMAINTIQMSVCAILSVPFAFLLESWPAHISASAWLSCFYMAAISTWFAFWLQTTAQKYTDAASASLLLCTESLWANIFGWLFMHEQKSLLMVMGGILIFAAVVITELSAAKGQSSEKARA